MGALDGFDVEVETTGCGVRADSGIARVRKRARLFAAETGDVVLVATEGLVLGGLELEAAKVGSNDGPHEIVCVALAYVYSRAVRACIPEAMACLVRFGRDCRCERVERRLEIILAAKTSRVGPSARVFCGEAAQRATGLPHRTPPCDNPVALGMRASTPSLRCCRRLLASRSRAALFSISLPPTEARPAFLGHGAHYLIQRPLRQLQRRTYHSTHHDEPTIYALSTASGKAAIAVIRISGSACRQVLTYTSSPPRTPNSRATDLRRALSLSSLPEATICDAP
jgi:hypothetical protein